MTKDEINAILIKEGDFEEFKLYGLQLVLKRTKTLGNWCGYVGIPSPCVSLLEAFPNSFKSFDVHGGVTYSQVGLPRDLNKNNCYYIGFDCAHYMDLIPLAIEFSDRSCIYRDKDYVRAQTISLAHQIKHRLDILKPLFEWSKMF